MEERLQRVRFVNNVLTVASKDRRDMISQSHPVGFLYDPKLLSEQINVMLREAEERGYSDGVKAYRDNLVEWVHDIGDNVFKI